MILLAFLMSKGRCMEPLYWDSIPFLYGIILTAPISVWLLIRWNKWARYLGIGVVAVSIAVSLDALGAATSSGIVTEYGIDFHFLLPCFGAGALPVTAATAAFVIPKRKQKPPTTSAISAN